MLSIEYYSVLPPEIYAQEAVQAPDGRWWKITLFRDLRTTVEAMLHGPNMRADPYVIRDGRRI